MTMEFHSAGTNLILLILLFELKPIYRYQRCP